MYGCSSELINIFPVRVNQNRKAIDNMSKYGYANEISWT